MLFSILTLFPEMFDSLISYSIVARAIKKKIVNLDLINIRDFSQDHYKSVDDRPYGGGVGMILKVDVLDHAIQFVKKKQQNKKTLSILLDPQGEEFSQSTAEILTSLDHIILLCGHYEGVDARVSQLVDKKVSTGKYILTGGELPAMTIIDAVTRLIPGVLPRDATKEETYTGNWGEYPQYTRPAQYKGMKVPIELLSGNHKEIINWKQKHKKIIHSKTGCSF